MTDETGGDPAEATPAELADRGPFPQVEGTLDRALALVEYLRAHCAWDRKQTARSLVPHLLEETYETVDAIHSDDPDSLRGELGDLLLNLAFQLIVAEEGGHFTRDEVVQGLEKKMVRRHPHLFGLGKKESWEAIKSRERSANADGPEPRTLEGIAQALDPLLRAHRIQEKVAGVGFDWDEASGALAKVAEELEEVEEAMKGDNPDALAEEMGDLLFSVVNLARLAGTHAGPSLHSANAKFQRRFEALERLARTRGVALPGSPLETLDELWEEVKREERDAGGSPPEE